MRWAFTFFIAVASVRITITESGPVLGPEQEKKRDLLSGVDKGYLDEEKLRRVGVRPRPSQPGGGAVADLSSRGRTALMRRRYRGWRLLVTRKRCSALHGF